MDLERGGKRDFGIISHVPCRESSRHPLFERPGDASEAESYIMHNIFSVATAEELFTELKESLPWYQSHHQTGELPRLICCHGSIADDGSHPVYRHPLDDPVPTHAWNKAVNEVRLTAEAIVGHPLNHALVQLYRNGEDYITEHSDKTLDIMPNSYIVNVSLGAQRVMRFRAKRDSNLTQELGAPRPSHHVPLPHNSLVALSLEANAKYLHGIKRNRRMSRDLHEVEKSHQKQRISLTFRYIGTFVNKEESLIWGRGARAKIEQNAHPVVVADHFESDRLLKAFGKENQLTHVAWQSIYGEGFDILHLGKDHLASQVQA